MADITAEQRPESANEIDKIEKDFYHFIQQNPKFFVHLNQRCGLNNYVADPHVAVFNEGARQAIARIFEFYVDYCRKIKEFSSTEKE